MKIYPYKKQAGKSFSHAEGGGGGGGHKKCGGNFYALEVRSSHIEGGGAQKVSTL